ncbi:MAG: molybdopterin-dependent oxidoreductase [Ignavibacteria bacterium]|nr:molybdopterin-dependent oxidoreductase [Ignavibacteria bacterium]
MPQLIIDGRVLEVEPGKTIIEAAFENGITIPHFCWHPALSPDGNCRMCLVTVGAHKKDSDGALLYGDDGNPEVSWFPKKQIACATPVTDGMIVDSISKETVETQNAVMEFLLINHPLDCPICDEAGQCKLQEYALVHSKGKSRFDEEKVAKDKRVQLGPNIIFDGERCISCSRCIRFADEVAKQPVLTFVGRGDKVTITTFPDTTFDSPYSMNVIDICPVGALTSMDFRFKARVWEMSFTDSVCPGCARGCNISIGVMNNEVLRTEPVTNMHVNNYWMCDHGRLAVPTIVNNNRTSGPMIRRDGVLESVTWDEAIAATVERLKSFKPQEITILGSSLASNEDNYLLAKLAKEQLQTSNIDYIQHLSHDFGDDMLRVNETAPNAIGAHTAGIAVGTNGHGVAKLVDRIKHGDVKVLVVLEDSLDDFSDELAEASAGVEALIVLTSHTNLTAKQASILLPTTVFAETEGTFTNIHHRVQHFSPAVVTKDNERLMTMKQSRWDKFGAPNDRWSSGEKRDARPAWKIIQALCVGLGANYAFGSSGDVFNDMAHHLSGFKDMSYPSLKKHQGLILGKGNSPEKEEEVYQSHVMKPA